MVMSNQHKKYTNYVALKMVIFPLIFAVIYAGNCARAGFSVAEKSGILASGVEGDEDFGWFEPSSLSIGPKSDRNNRFGTSAMSFTALSWSSPAHVYRLS
jgi:hypothetical protein